MARGRMIASSLGESRKFASLPRDLDRVVYTLIVANTDAGGRLEADPLYVTRKVCTRLPYEMDDVEQALSNLEASGLLVLYEAGGVPYLQVVNFRSHNTPHHREPASEIPPPEGFDPDGNLVTDATPKHGPSTAEARVKQEPSTGEARPVQADKRIRSEVKGSEVEEKRTPPLSPPTPEPVTEIEEEGFDPKALKRLQESDRQLHKRIEMKAGALGWKFRHKNLVAARALADPDRTLAALEATIEGPAEKGLRSWRYFRACYDNQDQPRQPDDDIERKYRGVTGELDGVKFQVLGTDPEGKFLWTDTAGYLKPEQVEAACHGN